MKKFVFIGLFFSHHAIAQSLISFINPMIGTGGHGHTFPGPTMPFGACQPGPDTRLDGWDGCSGYHYSDNVIYGFSHTHLSGTGCSDYGDILLMPVNKEMRLDQYQYKSTFDHKDETATAGYYSVKLKDHDILAEITPTLHGAVHRYTYPASDELVVLDLKHRDEVIDSKVVQVNSHTIEGYRYSKAWAKNQKVFYRITFSHPIASIQYESADQVGSETTPVQFEKVLHCLIRLSSDEPRSALSHARDKVTLMVKVSISGVDEQGAAVNMKAEMPDWDFNHYRKLAENAWESELSKVDVQDRKKLMLSTTSPQERESLQNQLTVFYTALYHCMIHPSLYSDVDGRYRGRDDLVHSTGGKFNYYTVFSLWDTYRALHPLLTILDKKRTNDFINTFIAQHRQGGRLPIWELSSNETNCMIGYHVVSVIWDAYNKGIRGYDAHAAFEAMKDIATDAGDYRATKEPNAAYSISLSEEAKARAADWEALESYNRFGYVRSDDAHESVSKTLEYAYNDWCIAQMAKALGRQQDYNYFQHRSRYWINVFDPTTGFMRARKNGTLYEPFSPYNVDNNFTEANSWQYSYYVPHDLPTMVQLLHGKAGYKKQLIDLFTAKEQTEGREQADITGLIGQYAHGNEPSHEIAFLFNKIGEEALTTEKVNFIRNNFYKNSPDGLIGNEDCGQMSAWFVMSAMGIYPVCPGDNTYEVTEPLFNNVKLLQKIDLRKMASPGLNAAYRIESSQESVLTHAMLLSSTPKVFKAGQPKARVIPSMSHITGDAVPFIKQGGRIFKDAATIELASVDNHPIVYCINDGKIMPYRQPIVIRDNTTIRFAHETSNETGQAPKWQTATFTELPTDRTVILKSTYSRDYHASGAQGMVDGIFGKLNWRAGDWQGYQGQDVEIILAFNQPKMIRELAANFLEDQNSWIFYPKAVFFYVSNDSVNWQLVERIPTNKSPHNETVSIDRFSVSQKNIIAGLGDTPYTYVKMVAKNFGPMPEWHEGRGYNTYIFIDELIVK